MSEAEQLTEQDILRIVRHFLLSSPPGEFEDVLSDVRELVQNDDLLNQGAYDIFQTYNIEQLIPLDVEEPEKHQLILSKYNELDKDTYYDPMFNKKVKVDHTKGIALSVEDYDQVESEETATRRNALQNELDKYIKDHYLQGLARVYPSQENPTNEMIVCITASKFNETNFWSGRWRSVYRVTFEDVGKAKVSGSAKVNVHYYENGNVQLNTSKEYGETVSGDSNDAIATAVVKMISKVEGSFQQSIDESCGNLTETFKTLRRRLPIYKKLFDFSSQAHQIAQEFSK